MKEEWIHAELIPTTNGGYVVRYRKHAGRKFSLLEASSSAVDNSIGLKLPLALLLCTTLIVAASLGAALLSHRQGGAVAYQSIAAPSLRTLIAKHQMLAQRSFTDGEVRFEKVNFIAQEIRKLTRSRAIDPSRLAMLIVEESESLKYDPLLVAAVVKAESTFNPSALSPAGAIGLMQIMPETGRFVASKVNAAWSSSDDLHVPEFNLRLGISYLQHLERIYSGDLGKVLVAYNWGPANLDRSLASAVKPPTGPLRYSEQVLATYARLVKDYERTVKKIEKIKSPSLPLA